MFFDKAYGISFEEILNMLLDPEKEGSDYTIEEDVKNQFKTTVKINTHITNPVAAKIDIPEHYSNMRELDRGRLLFYVKFKTSTAYLDAEEFNHLLGYELIIH